MTNNTYFYFEPFVYLKYRKKKVFAYNLVTGENIFLNVSSMDNIQGPFNNFHLVNDLNEKKKYQSLKRKLFGDLITLSDNKEFPVIIPDSFIKVKNNLKKIRNKDNYFNLCSNLFEIDLLLFEQNECDAIDYIRKYQFLYSKCIKESNKTTSKLFHILTQNERFSNLRTLNVYLGKGWNNNLLKEITTRSYPCEVNFHIHFEDLINKNIEENINFFIYFPDGFNKKIFNANFITAQLKNCKYIFLIKSEYSYKKVFNLTKDINNEYTFIPYFNGINKSFIEKFSFIDEKSLFNSKIQCKHIIQNSVLNQLDFGKLIILTNGVCYTNLFRTPIGNIFEDHFDHIIRNCHIHSESTWFLTRQSINTCKNCFYSCLCPPISNYEFAFGRFNLCKIKYS